MLGLIRIQVVSTVNFEPTDSLIMQNLPLKEQQIVQTHATLIVGVVQAAQSGTTSAALENGLKVSAENGWTALTSAIRQIIGGNRSSKLLATLDDEDRTIASAILRGLQDPASLPDPNSKPDGTMAAPGLAVLIHGARSGQADALQMLAAMTEQMIAGGGDMAKLGGSMKRLVDGERDLDKLSKGMGALGQSLLVSLVEELGKLDLQ